MKLLLLYSKPFSRSAAQPFSRSAAQPLSRSAAQPLSRSAAQPRLIVDRLIFLLPIQLNMHRRFPNIDNMGYGDRLTQPDASFANEAVDEQRTYYIRCRQYAPQSAP